jgi:predicted dehydrogenase
MSELVSGELMSRTAQITPVRIALAGAGSLGRTWSKVVLAEPEAKLCAFVDPLIGTEKQSAWLDETPGVPRFARLAAMTEEVDALLVTAFSTAHAAAVRSGLERGLHVIVEKPFATTLKDAEDLVALAAKRGVTLMVSQNYRFFPGSALIRDFVQSGKFGAVRAVFGEFWCDWAGKPYQHGMQHVMGLEMAVHHFDLVRAMFEAEPIGGYVREWQHARSQYAAGGAMEALFDMRGVHGQFPFTYSGSLIGKAPRTPWPGFWRIEFDTQTIVVDRVEGRYGVHRAHAEGFEWLGKFDGDDMLLNLPLAHFISSIRAGSEPWCSGRDNLGTLRMALGAEVYGPR